MPRSPRDWFLNMLRVFKPTSALSVGTCILSPFNAVAGSGSPGLLRKPTAERRFLVGYTAATITGPTPAPAATHPSAA